MLNKNLKQLAQMPKVIICEEMRLSIFSTLIIVLSLITSCTNAGKQECGEKIESGYYKVNLDSLQIEKKVTFRSVFKGLKVLALETNEKCLIGSIQKIEVSDSIIYVLDAFEANSLFAFDYEGKFLRQIGTRGKGPGEYLEPDGFSVDKENGYVFVLDGKSNKIIQYSLDGSLIKEIKLDINSIPAQITADKGRLYVDHLPNPNSKSEKLLKILDYKGNLIEDFFQFPDYNHGYSLLISSDVTFSKSNFDIKYLKPFSDTIFRISNNKIDPFIVFETKKTLDKATMNEIIENGMSAGSGASYKGFKGAFQFFESDSLIMFMFDSEYTNYFLLWKGNNEYKVASRLNDDLTLMRFNLMVGSYNNQFITYVNHRNFSAFVDNVKAGKIVVDIAGKEKIEKLSPDSNPILLFYECRGEMKKDNVD